MPARPFHVVELDRLTLARGACVLNVVECITGGSNGVDDVTKPLTDNDPMVCTVYERDGSPEPATSTVVADEAVCSFLLLMKVCARACMCVCVCMCVYMCVCVLGPSHQVTPSISTPRTSIGECVALPVLTPPLFPCSRHVPTPPSPHLLVGGGTRDC